MTRRRAVGGIIPAKTEEYCAIPVIAGHYYLVTVPAWSAVVSLDIAIPRRRAKSVASRWGPMTCHTGSRSRPTSGASS